MRITGILLGRTGSDACVANVLASARNYFSFSRPLKRCLLRVALVNDRSLCIPIILREGGGINRLALGSSSTLLSRIAIATTHPIVGHLISEMIFSTRGAVTSTKNDTLSLLHRIPNLRIKRGDVNVVNGKNVGICVGSHRAGLSKSRLVSCLHSCSTSRVLGIRIVAAPPSGCSTTKGTNVVGVHLGSHPGSCINNATSTSCDANRGSGCKCKKVGLGLDGKHISSFLGKNAARNGCRAHRGGCHCFPRGA